MPVAPVRSSSASCGRWPPRRTPSGRTAAARGRCTAATATTTPSSRRRSGSSPIRTRCSGTCAPAPPASRARSSRWPSTSSTRMRSTTGDPAGMVTSGGSASIAQAMLAYREQGREERGIERPNVVKPETGHPAFDKACHLFGIELRRAPVDPETTLVATGGGGEADRREHGGDRRLGRQLRLRHDRPDRRARRARARSRHRPARRWLPGRLHPPLRRGARLSASRPSTSACRASPASRPTPTSTATG